MPRFVKNCIPRIANSKPEHDSPPQRRLKTLGGREGIRIRTRESGIDVQQQRNGGGDDGDVPMYAFVRVQGQG